jgi:hypothetical protein
VKAWVETGEEGEYNLIDYLESLEDKTVRLIFVDIQEAKEYHYE